MKTLKQQEYEMNMDALSKITDWHRTTQHITGSYSITTVGDTRTGASIVEHATQSGQA